MITKKSSKEQDYKVLKAATDNCIKAYVNSKKTLSGCAVGQATRGYNRAIDYEMKCSEKLNKIHRKLEQKYNFHVEDNALVSEAPEKFNKEFNVGIVNKKAELNVAYTEASESYQALPDYKKMLKELLASYEDPESTFSMDDYAFLKKTPEYLKLEELREKIRNSN